MEHSLDTHLTQQELKILGLVADGLTNAEIAATLVVQVGTVEAHLTNVYSKLGVKGRVQAVNWYRYHISQQREFEKFLELVHDAVRETYRARIEGNHDTATSLAQFFLDKLRKGVIGMDASAAICQQLDTYRVSLLVELGNIYLATHPFNMLTVTTEPLAQEIFAIAKKHRRNEFFGLAYSIQGDIQYVQGIHRKSGNKLVEAEKSFNTALEKLKIPDNQVAPLRGLNIVWAELGNQTEFKRFKRQAEILILSEQISTLEQRCNLQEGIARAQRRLEVSSAVKSLEKWWEFYTEMQEKKQQAPFRRVQLARTQLEITKLVGNQLTLPDVGKAEMNLARKLGSVRHEKEIYNLL